MFEHFIPHKKECIDPSEEKDRIHSSPVCVLPKYGGSLTYAGQKASEKRRTKKVCPTNTGMVSCSGFEPDAITFTQLTTFQTVS